MSELTDLLGNLANPEVKNKDLLRGDLAFFIDDYVKELKVEIGSARVISVAGQKKYLIEFERNNTGIRYAGRVYSELKKYEQDHELSSEGSDKAKELLENMIKGNFYYGEFTGVELRGKESFTDLIKLGQLRTAAGEELGYSIPGSGLRSFYYDAKDNLGRKIDIIGDTVKSIGSTVGSLFSRGYDLISRNKTQTKD
ncbi:hypothetical protein ACFLZX_03715 [Nanoarchaeota archaeon]